MRMNFKVSFYLRSNYENKEGKSPVMLRVFLGGEMANFGTTKIFVKKSLWSNATSRLRGRTTEALSVNAALDTISTTLYGIYRKYENDESLSLDLIRTVYFGKNREFTSFLPVFDKFLEDIKQRVGKTIGADSLQKYSVLRRHFAEFLMYKYSRKDIGLNEFTPAVVQDFHLYMSTVTGCAYNTSVKKVKTLKTITIYAQKRGFLLHDPFVNHHFMPHKTLSTKGKTENTDRQGCEKKGRQTFSTFCLDFGWIRGDGIGGLQRAGWIEASQRAKNARKGA